MTQDKNTKVDPIFGFIVVCIMTLGLVFVMAGLISLAFLPWAINQADKETSIDVQRMGINEEFTISNIRKKKRLQWVFLLIIWGIISWGLLIYLNLEGV